MINKTMLLERLAHYGQQKATHTANMQAAGGAVQAIEELLAAAEALERASVAPPVAASTTTHEIVGRALERLAHLQAHPAVTTAPLTTNVGADEATVSNVGTVDSPEYEEYEG